ncbi:MAG: DUF4296 domain-containing protein [Prevotellaceae bacterium]|jgi:hypothetical protein|nr:DUF4296 domain-containing protein [Prevotellaceae bacterium]
MKYIVVILLVLATMACLDRRVISKSKITDIMVEMYIADAVKSRDNSLVMPYLRHDSISIYEPVFAKYGYTIDDFNASIGYYTNKPEVMKEIYSDVITRIKNMRDDYTTLSIQERKDQNLWRGRDSLTIDSNSAYTKFDFELPVKGKGIYTFTAETQFFDNDSTHNPRMMVWFAFEEAPDTIIGKKEITLNKKIQQRCTLKLYQRDTSLMQMKGFFVDYDSVSYEKQQHILIKNIYIEYAEGDGIDPVLPENSVDNASKKDSLSFNRKKPDNILDHKGRQLLMMGKDENSNKQENQKPKIK